MTDDEIKQAASLLNEIRGLESILQRDEKKISVDGGKLVIAMHYTNVTTQSSNGTTFGDWCQPLHQLSELNVSQLIEPLVRQMIATKREELDRLRGALQLTERR